MPNITVYVPEPLFADLEGHPEINRSEVVQRAFRREISRRERVAAEEAGDPAPAAAE